MKVGKEEEFWESVEVIDDGKMASYMRKNGKKGWDVAVDKYLIYWAKIYGFGEFFAFLRFLRFFVFFFFFF